MQISPLAKTLIRGFCQMHVATYRWLGGKGSFNRDTLILTTRGRKSGRQISRPLYYAHDGGKFYIVASFGGSDNAPAWYLNLQASPEVTVERETQKGRYRARTLSSAEAQDVWPRLLAVYPTYAEYQKKTTRQIPIVELSPLAG